MIKNTVLWALRWEPVCVTRSVMLLLPPLKVSPIPFSAKPSRSMTRAWRGGARPGSGCSSTGALYSEAAGYWDGKPTGGAGEWIMNDIANSSVTIRQTGRRHFDPANFDADEWVKIAKDAGMKYIVITSKAS